MDWTKLQDFKCPHCGEDLREDTEADEIRCTNCRFHIDPQKFAGILKHRTRTDEEFKRMRWQNLHDGLCPFDAAMLTELHRGSFMLRCTGTGCDFKISEERLRQIITDDSHPANRFKKNKGQESEEEKNQRELNNL